MMMLYLFSRNKCVMVIRSILKLDVYMCLYVLYETCAGVSMDPMSQISKQIVILLGRGPIAELRAPNWPFLGKPNLKYYEVETKY